MRQLFTDFNGADALLQREPHLAEDLRSVLDAVPVCLKASEQAGLEGVPSFDPVETNRLIKAGMQVKGWAANAPLPVEYRFLGTDVDFTRDGLVVEVQFSNYPFLLNNVLRAEVLYRESIALVKDASAVKGAVLIAKGGLFPSANSTLYYEQAIAQVQALCSAGIIEIPLRVIGLSPAVGEDLSAILTKYPSRYSRQSASQEAVSCRFDPPARGTRPRLTLIDSA